MDGGTGSLSSVWCRLLLLQFFFLAVQASIL